MSNNKVSSEIKVGILVLIGILILFYMSFRIGKFGVFREAGYNLVVYFDNANGLDPKTPVQLAGVEIGKVSRISLAGYKAKVTLSINEGVKIPVDSKIAIKSQGVLGDRYLELLPGKETTYLAQGQPIREVVSTPDFDEIFGRISVAAQSFGETMDQFKGIVGDKERAGIKQSIENIQVVSGEFKEILKENKGEVTRIVHNAADFSDRLNLMADKADETITGLNSIVKEVESGKGTLGLLVKDDKLYKDAKDTVTSLKSITSDIEQGKGTLGKLAKDDSLYVEAKETVKNVRDLTDGIKKGEGTLGKLTKDDSLYVEAERAMKKLQKGAEGLQEQTPITILGTIIGTFF
jgi:phospholipid/cholesterol/gamma-HCH transport system substrate-binding protein